MMPFMFTLASLVEAYAIQVIIPVMIISIKGIGRNNCDNDINITITLLVVMMIIILRVTLIANKSD